MSNDIRKNIIRSIGRQKIVNVNSDVISKLLRYGEKNRLLYYILESIDEDLLSLIQKQDKKQFYDNKNLRYLKFINEIYSINKLIKSYKPVFLKGAYFYLNGIQNRFCLDIDILVPKSNIPDLVKTLLSNNYNFTDQNFHLDSYNFNASHQLPAMRGVNGISIDIHHRLTSPFVFDEECLMTKKAFQNLENIKFMDQTFLCLGFGDALMHISYQALIHDNFSSGPSYLFDIRHLHDIYNKKDRPQIEIDYHRNLFNLSFSISSYLDLNFGTKHVNSNNTAEDAIDLLLLGNDISPLNRSFKTKMIMKSFKLKGYKNLVYRVFSLLSSIKYSILNIKNLYKMIKIRKYLED